MLESRKAISPYGFTACNSAESSSKRREKSGRGTFEVSPYKRAGCVRGRAHAAPASLQETFPNTGFTFSIDLKATPNFEVVHTVCLCRFRRQVSFLKQLAAGKCPNTCIQLQREKKRGGKKEPWPCCILFFYINNRADVLWPEANKVSQLPHVALLLVWALQQTHRLHQGNENHCIC